MKNIESYRSEFPITENYSFLNHAAVAPPSLRVVRAERALFDEFSHCGVACYPNWMKRIEEVRCVFAGLINASAEEIAFEGNTSQALSTVAAGLKWKNGDMVFVPEPEFPANVYPWMNLEQQGVKCGFIKRNKGRIGIKEIEAALGSKTRLISISSVDFASGFLCDLEKIGDFCRKKGILFCVDAIQSLGAIPMDVKKYGIHFLAAGGHKWLLGTMGCGILYVSSVVNDLVSPKITGWKSVVDEENFFTRHFELKNNAWKFEPGTMNVAGIYALGAAAELLMEAGIENIYKRILSTNDLLYQGLRDRGFHVTTPMEEKERSGILCFAPSSNPKHLFKLLAERKVMVSLRGEMIRLSPHFYNNNEDVERFFEVLDNV